MAYFPPGYGAGGGHHHGHHGHRGGMGGGMGGFEKRCFVIISDRNGEALDIRGNNANPGAEVLTWQRKMGRNPNQMWYCDQSGVIRSALNDFSLSATPRDTFRMMPFTGQADQQWIFSGNRIVNRMLPAVCMTDREGDRPCHAKEYKGKPRQHWRVEMV